MHVLGPGDVGYVSEQPRRIRGALAPGLHGKIVGLGAECKIPEICLQAVSKYPQFINTALVDDYCLWEAKGMGYQVEEQCMQAIFLGGQKEDGNGGTKPSPSTDSDYPWNKPSAFTMGGQRYASKLLVKAGEDPIPETGILDEDTCTAWADLCRAELEQRRKEDPLAMPANFLADRNTGDAFPCGSPSCEGRTGSNRTWAMVGMVGLVAVMGAVLYWRRS